MSPLCPPPGFPPHLAVIWPLIWAQILVLRLMVRAAYGKGTPYRWSVTPWGRAFIVSIDLAPGQKLAVLAPPAHSNARIAAALDGRAFSPEYLRLDPLSLGRGVGVRGSVVPASIALAATPRPLIPNPFSPGRRGLPLPET